MVSYFACSSATTSNLRPYFSYLPKIELAHLRTFLIVSFYKEIHDTAVRNNHQANFLLKLSYIDDLPATIVEKWKSEQQVVSQTHSTR